MNESTILGVSVRGWIAFLTVLGGFAFVFAAAFGIGGETIVMAALTAVVGWVGLVIGFYFGQKSSEPE
jgi:hypothetical protein